MVIFLISGLYSTLFPDNATVAFATYQLYGALANAVSLAYSPFICMSTKLYIMLFVITLSLVFYLILEYLEKKYPSKRADAKVSVVVLQEAIMEENNNMKEEVKNDVITVSAAVDGGMDNAGLSIHL